ncbi:MAG: alginate lyase family protein [Armatimonadota bacterium]
MRVLKKNLLDNTFPDGALREATTGYHSFSLGMFFDTMTRAKQTGLEVSEEHMKRLEAMFNYSMYSTQPDWTLPVWGDTNRPIDQTAQILRGGRYFNRQDMIWVGTKGKEGIKPARDSVAFMDAGYFIMRSGWDPKARYLATRNGFSQSHYHHDQLSVIVQARGSDLLPDMGVYTYGTPECNELVKTTSHSTISVDGADISPGNGENKWASVPGFDYFDGTSPGYNGLPEIRHRRRIVFVKPDYWVIADNVTGGGEHTSSQYWHFVPGRLDLDRATGVIRTTNTSGGNIAIIPVGPVAPVSGSAGYSGRAGEGQMEVSVGEGLYAVNWEKCTKAPVARYDIRGPLPHAFLTVLYPYPAEQSFDAKIRKLGLGDSSARAVEIRTRGSVGYVAFADSVLEVTFPDVRLELCAESVLVRTDVRTKKVTAFAWYEGRTLSFGSTNLASSDTNVRVVSARLVRDTIYIDTEGPAGRLRVATLGAKNAVINGKRVTIPRGARTIVVSQ